MDRRSFIQGAAIATLGLQGLSSRPQAAPARPRFVGVQSAPHSVFDEGAEAMLDFLANEAGVDTVCVATHTLHGGMERPSTNENALHGPLRAGPRPNAQVWIRDGGKPHPGTFLRMPQSASDREQLGGGDVLEALLAPAHARGMKVFARHLEAFHHSLHEAFPAFAKVRQEDIHGDKIDAPCWNHPAYRAFWLGHVVDVARRYPVDGFLLGTERDAPLEPLLHRGQAPYCFCRHCQRRAMRANIDTGRAREGMRKLHALVKSEGVPTDGMLTSILRLWLNYPEILAWETLQNDSKWSLYAEIYRAAKKVRRELHIGWHLPMYALNHDLFTRAAWDYGKLAESCDFLKPSIYQDVNASRLHGTVPELQRHYLREFEKHEIYAFILGALDLDRAREPGYEQARTSPFSAGYVHHETRRCVVGAAGKARVYAGIGVDIPKDGIKPDANACYEAARAALRAGADGLLLSREYHFMRKESLNAVKRAIHEAGA